MNKEDLKLEIAKHCSYLSLCAKGYVPDNPEINGNLISQFSDWSTIKEELSSGQGGELDLQENGLRRINAVHSSTALCVNNFAPIHESPQTFILFGKTNFTYARFEERLKTGISTPNIDFLLKSESDVFGFESKFTETLNRKLPNQKNNLAPYRNRKQLSHYPKAFHLLIEDLLQDERRLQIDVAQLLKHAMAIINETPKGKTPTLVYIFWLPTNWEDIPEYLEHQKQTEEFKKKIERVINFVSISYLDFWELCARDRILKPHIEQVRARYSMKLPIKNAT